MRRVPPVVTVTAILLAVGMAVALGWFAASGDDVRRVRIRPDSVVLLLALTAFNVFTRFVRWHFMLRRVEVKIPTRPSLAIYLASLTAIVTPAYIGEVSRSVFVRRRFGAPMSRTLPVLVMERGLDVLVLATVGTAMAGNDLVLGLMSAGYVGLLAVLWIGARVGGRLPSTGPAIERLLRGSVLIPAVGLSFLAWVPACWLIALSASAVGASVPWGTGMAIFSRSTLLGGLSLMPAGVGATGSAAILGLREIGLDLATCVAIVTVMRLVTAGFTVAVGLVCLVPVLRRATRRFPPDSRDHFDAIADVYNEQLAPHIRDLLVARKVAHLHQRLAEDEGPMARGLDLGCGQGLCTLSLERRGYRIVGVDPSIRSIERAREAGATVVAASGVQLPFHDGSFDFVYAIGVLHHLPAGEARAETFREIRRVLRTGGRLLIHETNRRNPLFRFYMGYIFPIVRRIDEGTELWLDPDGQVPGMTRVSIDFATFLPDFAPRAAVPLLLRVERRLEASRWRKYSVHYLAVFRATDAVPREELDRVSFATATSVGGHPGPQPTTS